MLHKSARASEFKVLVDDEGTFQAIVSVTNIVDEVNDVILPGAYHKTLSLRNPKVCWGHDWKQDVGKVTNAVELMPTDPRLPQRLKALGAGALLVEGKFNLKTQRGREAWETVKFWGDEGEWSIGYDCSPGNGKAYFDKATGQRNIEELALFEVSPVLFGANTLTGTLAMKSLIDAEEKDHFLRDVETKRDYTQDQRDEYAKNGVALPDGSYPIPDVAALHDAVASIGRAGAKGGDRYNEVRSHIEKRARALDATDQLPETWSAKTMNEREPVPQKAAAMKDGTETTTTKAWVTVGGSYEAKIQVLGEAVDRWLTEVLPGTCAYSWIEATFDDKAVVGVGYTDDDGDCDGCEFWSLPYKVLDDGSVTLGMPSLVNVIGAISEADSGGPEVDFMSADKVIAQSLAVKNATRLRRRLLLLDRVGIDISTYGVTPAQLGITPGTGMVPDESSDDSFDGVTDTSLPGFQNLREIDPVGDSYLDHAGSMGGGPSVDDVRWMSGTWVGDANGNLHPIPGWNRPLPAVDPAGNMEARPVQPHDPYKPGNLSSGKVPAAEPDYITGAGVVPSELGKSAKNATRIRKRARLLGQLQGTLYRAAPGAGGQGSSPRTLTPATGLMSDEALAAGIGKSGLYQKTVDLLVTLKEGRMLSGVNAEKLKAAHLALDEVLRASGAFEPLPENQTAGADEDGVPIEVEGAKARLVGLDESDWMEWQQAKATPV